MTYIPLNEKPEGQVKEIFNSLEKDLGMVPNVFKGLANSPAALNAYLAFNQALASGKLCPKLKEKIAVTVAAANTCGYCASAHTALGSGLDIPAEELALNLEAKSECKNTEAVLKLAKSIIDNKGRVHGAELEAVEEAGYDSEQIVEIIAVTSINIFTNYFNHIAGTEVDFPLVKLQTVAA